MLLGPACVLDSLNYCMYIRRTAQVCGWLASLLALSLLLIAAYQAITRLLTKLVGEESLSYLGISARNMSVALLMRGFRTTVRQSAIYLANTSPHLHLHPHRRLHRLLRLYLNQAVQASSLPVHPQHSWQPTRICLNFQDCR